MLPLLEKMGQMRSLLELQKLYFDIRSDIQLSLWPNFNWVVNSSQQQYWADSAYKQDVEEALE